MNAQRDLWLPPIEDRPPSGYAYSLMGIARREDPPLRESYLRYAYVRVTPTGPRDPGQSRYRMPLYFPELWPEHDGRPYTLGYDLSWSIPRCDMCHRVWAQMRADAAATADYIARVMDPRTRRSPSMVDRIREGLAEIEAAWRQTARRLGSLGPAPQPRPLAAGPAVQLVINGQQIQVGEREGMDLVRLLVRDPIVRARLARAATVAW